MALFGRSTVDERRSDHVLFEVWGQRGWPSIEVVGESNYSKAIRALFPARLSASGQEITIDVTVVHEPKNVHDKNAVKISAPTGIIGYLAREEAVRYAPALARMQVEGVTASTKARVWGQNGYFDTAKTSFVGSVTLDLPAPHMLVPANRLPSGRDLMLPVGSAIQVGGEENHGSALACCFHARIDLSRVG